MKLWETCVVLCVASAAAAAPPSLRLCTGKKGNNYYVAGAALAKALASDVQVEVIETEGSWANLAGIDAEPAQCDAIIAQDDAAVLYEFENPKSTLMMDRMGTLYPEFVHVVCNRAVGVERVADLAPEKHKVLVNTFGSGTYVTWKLLGRLNPEYSRLPVAEAELDAALEAVAAGRDAQCLVAVSGVRAGAGFLAATRYADRLTLLSLVDPSLHRAVGRGKRPVYRAASIPADAYPKWLDRDTQTQEVSAVFFLSPEWHARHPAETKKIATALASMSPSLTP